jgi:capsular polysaccharide biosynthesis protein
MARMRERVFALSLAVIFFAVSFGLSFFVIWELYKDNKEAKNVNQQSTASTDATKSQESNMDNKDDNTQ